MNTNTIKEDIYSHIIEGEITILIDLGKPKPSKSVLPLTKEEAIKISKFYDSLDE